MRAADQAGKESNGGVKPEQKKVMVVLKTTPRELAGALLALGASPSGRSPLVLDACSLDSGLP